MTCSTARAGRVQPLEFPLGHGGPFSRITETLRREQGLSSLVATCLVNRGIVTTEAAEAFLDPRLKSLSDPMVLPDIRLAIDRLFLARERNEPLVILGITMWMESPPPPS